MKQFTLQQVKEKMRNIALIEMNSQPIEARGDTLEDALMNAAKKAGVSPNTLEYEIVDRGSKGIAGIGSLQYRILARVNEDAKESQEGERLEAVAKDGQFYIRTYGGRILLKVTPPKQGGAPVLSHGILEMLRERTDGKIDKNKVEAVVERAKDVYESIGYFENNALENGIAKCTIAPDQLTASIILFPPGLNGADLTEKDIRDILYEAEVLEGVDNAKIKQVIEYPEYYEPVDVAFGKPPIKGENAIIQYNFEASPSEYVLRAHKDAFTMSEFVDLQNVRKGDVVAEKIPLKLGKDGRAVTGEHISAPDGIDRDIPIGANVSLSEDKKQAIANTSGVVRIRAECVVIDPVYTVNGNAGIKTGSIDFVGSVIIKGNVEDNVEIIAEGDINVLGTVGNAILKASGNIYVLRGISGGTDCKITSGASIIARFAENCSVRVKEFLVVSDGIINSEVISMNSVISRGRRASIVGGSITATKLVETKNLGSKTGAKTHIEVGVDPEVRMREIELTRNIAGITKEIQQLKNHMDVLERRIRLKKVSGGEKNVSSRDSDEFREGQERLNELISKRREEEYELESIKEELSSHKAEGSISVYRKIYPGVQVIVGGERLQIQREQQYKTYVSKDGVVIPQTYEEPRVDIPTKH